MYATSTAIAQIASTGTDIALVIGAVVASVMVGWAALTGVGFLRRKVAHYVAGRKF